MDVINRQKARRITSFSAKVTEIDQLLADPNCDTIVLKTGVNQLENQWNNLSASYDELMDNLDAVVGDPTVTATAEDEWADREGYHDEYVRIDVAVKEIIEARRPQPPPPPPHPLPLPPPPPPSPRRIQLPKLQLQPFDGDVLKWTSFWESFENAVHKHPDLPDEEKFNHLRMNLRGGAEKSVEGLSLTAASYAKAIDILKREYGQKDTIIQTRLLHLYRQQDGRRVTDTASLRKLNSEVNVNVRKLEALGHPIDTLGSVLVTLLQQKLPDDLQIIWMRDRTRDPTDYEALLDFIRNELIIRDQRDRLNAMSVLESDSSKPASKDKTPSKSPVTAAALTVQTNKEGTLPCLFCNEKSHRSGKFKTDLDGRKAALRKAGRCYICTRKGHRASECSEGRKCANCGGKHHVFICDSTKSGSGDSGTKPAGGASTDTATKEAKAMLVATVAEAQPEEPALFMTGQLIVEGSSGKKQCRILIDSGSKLTYISKRLSEAVGATFLVKEKLKISAFAGAKTETNSRKVAVELGSLHDPRPWYPLKANETEAICDPLLPLATGDWLRQMQNLRCKIQSRNL